MALQWHFPESGEAGLNEPDFSRPSLPLQTVADFRGSVCSLDAMSVGERSSMLLATSESSDALMFTATT